MRRAMSNESNEPKKLSTADILARARAQAAAKAAGETPAAEPAAAEPAPAAEAPVAEAPAAKPAAAKPAGGAPKSTAEILAAARAAAAAKAAGGEAAPAEAKPAGGAPKSTAEILAAARAAAAAKAGGAAPAAEGAKPAAKATVAAAAGDGPKASVNEMLAAVRGEKPAEPKPAVAAPPMPQKPVPTAAKKKTEERRSILAVMTSAFALGWLSLGGAVSAGVLGVLRFMMPNVLTEPPSKFKVGATGDFDLGTVSEKFKASNGIWIVHTDRYQGRNLIYALSTVCTHLGCTPSWLEGEQKFKCPCHGSGFYINGINFEGPAPRPLERVGIRIAEDGMLEVDKSLKFQEEMGQWSDSASYVEV